MTVSVLPEGLPLVEEDELLEAYEVDALMQLDPRLAQRMRLPVTQGRRPGEPAPPAVSLAQGDEHGIVLEPIRLVLQEIRECHPLIRPRMAQEAGKGILEIAAGGRKPPSLPQAIEADEGRTACVGG